MASTDRKKQHHEQKRRSSPVFVMHVGHYAMLSVHAKVVREDEPGVGLGLTESDPTRGSQWTITLTSSLA